MSNENEESKEVETLSSIWELLKTLPLGERARVLQWASQRTIADAKAAIVENKKCSDGLAELPDQLEEVKQDL